MRCPRALALTALVLPLDDAHAPSAQRLEAPFAGAAHGRSVFQPIPHAREDGPEVRGSAGAGQVGRVFDDRLAAPLGVEHVETVGGECGFFKVWHGVVIRVFTNTTKVHIWIQPFFTRHAVNEARPASFAYLLGAAAGPAGSGARPSLFTYVNDVT